jgi:hypothetical protein
MLTFRVVASRHSDGFAPCSPLPATSHVTKSPVAHRLSAQTLTKCFFRNSLVLKAIHLSWGVYTTLCWLCPTTVIPSIAYLLSLSPLYSHSSALCAKKRPGVPRFFSRIEVNWIRPNHISIGGTHCRLHRQPTRTERSPCPRFASLPHCFLVNYSDPILYSAGPAGHLSHSAPRPRS